MKWVLNDYDNAFMHKNRSISQDDAKNYVPMEIVAYYLATSATEVTVSIRFFRCSLAHVLDSIDRCQLTNEERNARASVLPTS